MSGESSAAFDVFLSHAPVDGTVAGAVGREFEAAGLRVFSSASSQTSDRVSARRGLQESVAFVPLVTPSHLRSTHLMLELGAAWALATPVFPLLSGVGERELPSYLRQHPAVPLWGGMAGVVSAVRELANPLTEDDREALTAVYLRVGVSVDRLVTESAAGDQLAEGFHALTHRHLAPSRLVRELLRIRKAGKLPKLTQRSAS